MNETTNIIEYSERDTINKLDCMTKEIALYRVIKKANELGLNGYKFESLEETYNRQSGYSNILINSKKIENKELEKLKQQNDKLRYFIKVHLPILAGDVLEEIKENEDG